MAYEEVTHQRMTGLTVDIMRLVKYEQEGGQETRFGGIAPLSDAPNGIAQTEWDEYLKAVAESAGRLMAAPSGLRDFAPCQAYGKKLYELPPIKGDLRLDYIENYVKAGLHRDCFQEYPRGELFTILNEQYPVGRLAGSALGVHAAQPDHYEGDWSVFFAGTDMTTTWFDKAIDFGVEFSLASVIARFSCFVRWVAGKPRCNAGDIRDMASHTNVLPELRGLALSPISAFSFEHGFTTGLGHLMNFSPAARNQYDDVGGFDFHHSGWRGRTGTIDGAIMVASDILGVSINPRKSGGARAYEICDGTWPCDRSEVKDGHPGSVYRTDLRWQANTVGHTEFTPLDNLAYFGWQRALNPNFPAPRPGGPIRVEPAELARPLHALGDIAAPHHLIAGLGWGHRPYEVMVKEYWGELQTVDKQGISRAAQYEAVRAILVEGLRWHRFINEWRRDFRPDYALDIPVRDMLTAMGTRNYS